MTATSLPWIPSIDTLRTLWDSAFSDKITFAGMRAHVPGSLPIRVSVTMGNLRMQHLLSTLVQPGDTVVDIGANIGYNTLFAAQCVGPTGQVVAIEPAQDNLTILYANLFANNFRNITVFPYAAGRVREVKTFFLRGTVSAVNSLYQENFYHPVTETVEVLAVPLDELLQITPNLVKIDVEGGELEVLHGMARILSSPTLRLIVEWHPTLQVAAGYSAEALPSHLLALGYRLQVVTHTTITPFTTVDLPHMTTSLLRKRSPVELLAMR